MIRKTLSGELVAEFGLCKDRHEYPVNDCIYPETVQRMNFARLELTATSVLKPLIDQGIKSVVVAFIIFQAEDKTVKNLEKMINHTDEIIQHMIIRKEMESSKQLYRLK